MFAKCCKCNDYWNISTKTDLSKPYICPKCEYQAKRNTIKTTQHKKSIGKTSKVLLNNKSKFASI